MYLRISKDADGTQTATSRQREDCEGWIARNGAVLVDVYEDVDTSAFNRNVRRPQFERMLADVRDRRFDGVIAWKIDRIARRQRDFVRLDEACEDVGAFVATVADALDTRTSRLMAELLVSFARQETENMSLRMRRKNAADFEQGKPHAGGRRPFGYTGGTERHVIDEEAQHIREAARRLLDGESCNVIAQDWNERGIGTASGNRWAADGISAMLRSPTIVGRRAHRGQVHAVRGWEPIISDEDFAAIGAILAVRASRMHGPRTKHLLTGLAACGACGHPLWGSATGRGVYRCPKGLGSGCGRVVRHMKPVEEAVRDMWAYRVASPTVQALLAQEVATIRGAELGSLATVVREDEDALNRLTVAHFSERRISEAEYYAARDAIKARLVPNRARLERGTPSASGAGLIGLDVAALLQHWDRSGPELRRQYLTTVLEQVKVLPAGRGIRFDVRQLVPVWRY